jgi:hypothetical protein
MDTIKKKSQYSGFSQAKTICTCTLRLLSVEADSSASTVSENRYFKGLSNQHCNCEQMQAPNYLSQFYYLVARYGSIFLHDAL